MIFAMTLADLKDVTANMQVEAAVIVAKQLWGTRARAYVVFETGHCFIAVLPELYDVDPEFHFMPNHIIGYGEDWEAAFSRALTSKPVLLVSSEPEPEPPPRHLKSLNDLEDIMAWRFYGYNYWINRPRYWQAIYDNKGFAADSTLIDDKPKPKRKHSSKNWKPDPNNKIPQAGPKPQIRKRKGK